mgnify:FL=1
MSIAKYSQNIDQESLFFEIFPHEVTHGFNLSQPLYIQRFEAKPVSRCPRCLFQIRDIKKKRDLVFLARGDQMRLMKRQANFLDNIHHGYPEQITR